MRGVRFLIVPSVAFAVLLCVALFVVARAAVELGQGGLAGGDAILGMAGLVVLGFVLVLMLAFSLRLGLSALRPAPPESERRRHDLIAQVECLSLDEAREQVERLLVDGSLEAEPAGDEPGHEMIEGLAPELRRLLSTHHRLRVGPGGPEIGREHLAPTTAKELIGPVDPAVLRKAGPDHAGLNEPFLRIGREPGVADYYARLDGEDEAVYRAEPGKRIEAEAPTVHHWLLVHCGIAEQNGESEQG